MSFASLGFARDGRIVFRGFAECRALQAPPNIAFGGGQEYVLGRRELDDGNSGRYVDS